MICKIADLLVEIPASGGMAPRCGEYLHRGNERADIVIRTEFYSRDKYPENSSEDSIGYMESGRQFYAALISFDGFFLHASAVELDGRAYLFSAPSGTGKSTHTRLWQSLYGNAAQVFNDDKPALRRLNGCWYAYGTPWCGKDGINQNKKIPLAGICFLKRGNMNQIRRLDNKEAVQKVFSQTFRKFWKIEKIELMLSHVDKLVREIPIYELECLPNEDAARVSYETMRRGAEENGL